MTAQVATTDSGTGARALRLAGLIGLAGIAIQTAVLLIAPFVRPDVDLIRDGLSHYAVGPGSGMQEMGFVALGVACAAIGVGLLLLARETRFAGVLLALAAFGFAGLSVFPMGQGGPMTPIGDLHLTAGTLGVTLQFAAILAMLLWPGGCAAAGVSTRLGWSLAAIAGLAAAGIQVAIWNPSLGLPEGLLARVAIVPLLAWWAVVALALARGRTAAMAEPATSSRRV